MPSAYWNGMLRKILGPRSRIPATARDAYVQYLVGNVGAVELLQA